LQEARAADEQTLKNLRAENELLRKQLSDRPAVATAPTNDQADKELASTKAALQSSRDTLGSLQVRVRTLEEERDRLDKTRRDLEGRLSSMSNAAPNESAQVKNLKRERDDLQKKLNETNKQLADNRAKTKETRAQQPLDDISALRARLEALEARKIPYTPEELALFKKPQDVAAVTKPVVEEKPNPSLPANVGNLMAEAQHAFAARRFDEAEKKYREVLQVDDKNVATLQRLAAAQLEQSRPKDAEETLKRALDLNGNDARSLLLMGISKFDQERYDDAFEKLSRSAQIDPQNPETQNYLGITLSQKGQRAAAETALRRAIQLDPGYKSAHYNLAVVYATQQPPFIELARWHYQKALAYGHPSSAELERMLDRKQANTQK
jgi:tetratricopeptide (TPR) repeat protein